MISINDKGAKNMAKLDMEKTTFQEVLKTIKDNYIKDNINESFSWDHTIYVLLSIAYYNTEEYNLSLININKALEI